MKKLRKGASLIAPVFAISFTESSIKDHARASIFMPDTMKARTV
jgi:hypothetical protein